MSRGDATTDRRPHHGDFDILLGGYHAAPRRRRRRVRRPRRQMNRHSTLVCHLKRLVWALVGNFGRAGTTTPPNGLANLGRGDETGPSTRPRSTCASPKPRASSPSTPSRDAARLNLGEGSRARLATERGSQVVVVELSDRMQRGHISLPNGMGLGYPADDGLRRTGTPPNELTSTGMRDEYVGTPWHKSVPARVEPVG